MALNKSLYKGKRELTMEQFQNLDVIDENTDYDIMDYPDNGMTNAQLVRTLNYNRLFKVGHITICLDDGVFRKGHILQLQVVDNVRIWKDITATSALDIDDLAKLGGLPLGAIIPIAMVTNDPYVQPLDGRNLSQNGIYADFCTWLKNRLNEDANNVPTCTIGEYAAEMATYGQCGKFVINDTATALTSGNFSVPANSIKLPTITEFIASNNGGDAIGLAELDDIKTHRHMMPLSDESNVTGSGGGLSSASVRENWQWTATALGTAYTGGEETRPKNIRYPYYIVVAIGTKTNVEINLNNIANELNNINNILSVVEKSEVIYDKYEASKNYGYSDGLRPRDGTINVFNFTKYKRLIITCDLDSNPFKFIATIESGSSTYTGGGMFPRPDGGQIYLCGVKVTATTFTVVKIGYTNGSTFTDRDNNETYKVQKIEGIY